MRELRLAMNRPPHGEALGLGLGHRGVGAAEASDQLAIKKLIKRVPRALVDVAKYAYLTCVIDQPRPGTRAVVCELVDTDLLLWGNRVPASGRIRLIHEIKAAFARHVQAPLLGQGICHVGPPDPSQTKGEAILDGFAKLSTRRGDM